MNSLTIFIRPGKTDDVTEMQKMFVDTVTSICAADYNQQQIGAWVSGADNTKRWEEIITEQFVLIALHKDTIVGFATLKNQSYLDLLYVHKDYQRQGIAGRLLAEITKEALRAGQTGLSADVSKTARPFFEKNGVKHSAIQKNLRQGIEILNYKMIKHL